MDHSSQSSLFTLQSNPDQYIYTGSANDCQLLIGLMYPSIITVFFDTGGSLVTLQERPLSQEALDAGTGGVFDDVFNDYFRHDLESWMQELHFRPMSIRVRGFFISEYKIGIENPRQYWGSILDETRKYPDWNPDDIQQIIQDWEDVGQFVFWWNNDYYVDNQGRIVAS